MLQENGNESFKTTYSYDEYDRLTTKSIVLGTAKRQELEYTYRSEADYQTERIESIYNTITGKTQRYEYNAQGYVTEYGITNETTQSYTYDSAGRLSVDGRYEYAYDDYNNLEKIKEDNIVVKAFTYDAGNHTQLMHLSENGTDKYFAYDSMGNMIMYKGSSATPSPNMSWTRGNMLSSGYIKGKFFSYEYGPDNLRYRKTVNNAETLYYWDGDVLVGEKSGTDYTIYLYDAMGIAGMVYNGAYYYFEKNLFGDVIKAYNSSGSGVAEFKYDSYGNIVSESGSMADKVKMRYRSYYWDEETGFYYLQSRYYDPSICRFISADQYELVGVQYVFGRAESVLLLCQ